MLVLWTQVKSNIETRESVSLALMLLSSTLSAVGVVVLWMMGHLPVEVYGRWSLSTILIICSAWPAMLSFGFGYVVNQGMLSAVRRMKLGRRWLHFASMSLAFALLFGVIGLLIGLFIRQAFVGWIPEPIAVSLLVIFTSAISSYVTIQISSQLNTIQLLQIAVLFLSIGICVSMLLNEDPSWWQRSFSYLGDLQGNTFMLFSFTLIVVGVMLVSITDLITRDIDILAQSNPVIIERVPYIKILFFGLAMSIALIGLIPNVDGHLWGLLHNIVARIVIGIYILLIVGSRWLLPDTSRMFTVFSYLVIGLGFFFYFVMYKYLRYLNVMSFELLTFFMGLGWFYLLLQTIIARSSHLQESEQLDQRSD